LSAAAAIGAALLVLGPRPDYVDPDALAFLCVKLLFAGTGRCVRRILPPEIGATRFVPKLPLTIALPFVAIMLLAIASLSFFTGLALAAYGFAWRMAGVSRFNPAYRNRAVCGAGLGRSAGCTDKSGPHRRSGRSCRRKASVRWEYALHCMADSLPFIAIWYGGTIALCTLAGAKLGPRLFEMVDARVRFF